MPSRRSSITMDDREIDAFLAEPGRTVYVASHLPSGDMHLAALWYGFTAEKVMGFTTYRRSQKVKNLERDPRFSAIVETGITYGELRGVEMIGTVELIDDPGLKHALSLSTQARYPIAPVSDDARERILANRVAVLMHPQRLISWDHRKLGGTY